MLIPVASAFRRKERGDPARPEGARSRGEHHPSLSLSEVALFCLARRSIRNKAMPTNTGTIATNAGKNSKSSTLAKTAPVSRIVAREAGVAGGRAGAKRVPWLGGEGGVYDDTLRHRGTED